MIGRTRWFGLALLSSGCLGAGNGFDPGIPQQGETVLEGDDGAAHHSVLGELGSPAGCPQYPTEKPGWREGEIVHDLSLPGNGPEELWSMDDFWCMAHEGPVEERATVLVLTIHSMT